jgi:hypothetical protein
MRRLLPFALAGLLTASAAALGLRSPSLSPSRAAPPAPPADPAPARAQPLVQIALLLDTSSSMDGLLHQAQAQLWSVVNAFDTARRDGVAPRLEIALYEYGKSTVPASQGYIRQVSPFTTNLDRLSEQLFALTTNGGDEFCGQVIQTATRDLDWSARPDALKLIFIAGNEPFTQGPVDFHAAIRSAAERGIRVNTVYAGAAANEEAQSWREGAAVADGRFFAIEQDRVAQEPPAPQDAEIARLGVALNQTYLAYGAAGAESQARQAVQDRNAQHLGSAVQRSLSKASRFYGNADWDLVDADSQGQAAQVPEAQLPPELRGKTPAEREAVIAAKRAEREALQARINALSAERQRFLAAHRAEPGADTLDGALVTAVREEAARQRFVFE